MKHFTVQWQEGDPVVVEVAKKRPYSGATPLQAISLESLRITEQVEKQQEKLNSLRSLGAAQQRGSGS